MIYSLSWRLNLLMPCWDDRLRTCKVGPLSFKINRVFKYEVQHGLKIHETPGAEF